MKILSIMPAFNESDIIRWSVRAMQEQGVDVYVIDGWSTDGTWETLPTLGLAGYERFPAAGDTGTQECRAILHRIEDIARESGADWIYYSDADEVRRPKTGETLHQAIARLDRAGYSAIDHDVRVFFPIDDWWTAEHDPEQHFRFYDDTEDMLCKPWIKQVKCWKNIAPVTLAGGGHEVQFPGRKLSPEKFWLNHYPWRNTKQAEARLRTRLARRCHAEYQDGWGVHYDDFASQARTFIRNSKTLKEVVD